MNPSISKGIIQFISKLRENHEFDDFKVTVDGDIYNCHSCILAGSSEFFKCLLRSNMKEKQEMTVELNNISSPIFQLILNSLYTGCDMLTKENVLEVWSAVHQLQIQFLIEHCEEFVMANLSLDTVEMYKQHAEYLQSEKVCECIFNFILKNFGTLIEKEIFLRLDFQFLSKLLESDKLEVSSEDLVLNSLLYWVNYGNVSTKKSHAIKNASIDESLCTHRNDLHAIMSTQNMVKLNSITEKTQIDQGEPNEREKFLIPLLKSTRLCLASGSCILSLYQKTQSDILVKEVLLESFTFKFCDFWHGHWPSTAIQRDCSSFEHVGVYCYDGKISALSFKKDKWFYIRSLPKQLNAKLIVCKGKLYACSIGSAPNEIYVFKSNMWVHVTEISHAAQLFLTHEKNIYIVDSIAKQITRFSPETSPIKLQTFGYEIENLTYALSFHNHIVAFSSLDNNGVEETAVHSWNTETNLWTQHNNLKFLPQNMTSFRGDRDTYILDSTGALLKLTDSETVGFTFVARLWSRMYNIKAALLFRETLYLCDDSPDHINALKKVEGVFSSKKEWRISARGSNMVHHLIPFSLLKPRQPAAS